MFIMKQKYGMEYSTPHLLVEKHDNIPTGLTYKCTSDIYDVHLLVEK